MQPDTRYAKSGEVNIAYQMFGEGPRSIDSLRTVRSVHGQARLGGKPLVGITSPKVVSTAALTLAIH